jgi:hypothetical protein
MTRRNRKKLNFPTTWFVSAVTKHKNQWECNIANNAFGKCIFIKMKYALPLITHHCQKSCACAVAYNRNKLVVLCSLYALSQVCPGRIEGQTLVLFCLTSPPTIAITLTGMQDQIFKRMTVTVLFFISCLYNYHSFYLLVCRFIQGLISCSASLDVILVLS